MRRLIAGLVAALFVLAAAPVQAAPGWHPSSLVGVDGADQVVVVTASSWSARVGTLRAYERDGDGWREVLGATKADLGATGLVPGGKRRQGTGKTPTGTFAITSALGRQADPGTDLTYHRFDRDDRWTFDPKSPSTYNLLQPNGNAVRDLRSEHLWRFGRQYDYVAVLDFNLPDGQASADARGVRRVASDQANTRMGGAIFLHVTTGKPTAGCISIPRDQMRGLLQWLDPTANPTIVIQVTD